MEFIEDKFKKTGKFPSRGSENELEKASYNFIQHCRKGQSKEYHEQLKKICPTILDNQRNNGIY